MLVINISIHKWLFFAISHTVTLGENGTETPSTGRMAQRRVLPVVQPNALPASRTYQLSGRSGESAVDAFRRQQHNFMLTPCGRTRPFGDLSNRATAAGADASV